MKKVLVTGATGFIGHHVIDVLIENGFKVIASSAHPEKARTQSWFNQVEYVPLDLSQYNDDLNYFDFFDRPDAMLHLAWEGLPNYKSSFHETENLPRHEKFLSNMIRHGLSDLTVTGTCLEYGMQEGCLDEDMPVFPGTSYAIAKNELRMKLQSLQRIAPFNFKWLRLFYTYGQGQNANSILSQLDSAIEKGEHSFNMSGGEQIRDYLPVTAMADYMVRIMDQREVQGVVNCCSGLPISISQLVENYLARKNVSIHLNKGFYPYSDYEPMAFWGDVAKLHQIIGD